MARRTIEIDGTEWRVYPSGRVTTNDRDEFGLVFEHGTGPDRVRRLTRFSPVGPRRRDAALRSLSEERLREFFRQSQPEQTSPEVEYGRRPS
ncbi:MAG: hypothetical protein PVF27_07940 [Gemmatimonadales bacterium]|jgi:hypothetical protein